jgi:hypothetical protein
MTGFRKVHRNALLIGSVLCWLILPVETTAKMKEISTGNSQPALTSPGAKQIIRALLTIQDVRLSLNNSCKNVGGEFSDLTIGDYVSGLLAELNKDEGKNWIEASCRKSSTGRQSSDCKVSIGRQAGEEVWVRGVDFRLKADHLSVVKASIQCTGAG